MATAIIATIIFGCMALVVIKEIKKIKSGKSICGGNCSSCSGCASHRKNHCIEIKK